MKFKIKLIISILLVGAFLPATEYKLLKAERAEILVSDNLKLIGSYYPVKEQNPPAVILLHMLGRNRGDWNVYARHLQKEGIAVLSLDLRGHGESTNHFLVYWRSFKSSEFQKYIPDLNRAMVYLEQNGIDPKKTGILGIGIGANLAVNYAARQKRINTLVLVDPGADYQGIKISQALLTLQGFQSIKDSEASPDQI